MSNWFAFNQITQPEKKGEKGKNTVFYIISSTLILLIGIWLLIFSLNKKGYHLFESPPYNPRILPASFSPTVLYWEEQIEAWSQEFALDPILIATVMQIESCGNPKAISSAGAQGLFQVMPHHFSPGEAMRNPQTNAEKGLAYLKQSYIKANGDIQLTLAGYNGGHSQISRPSTLWPEETQRYVYWGSGIYREMTSGGVRSETLDAWLEAGGWHLCQTAEKNLRLP